MLAKRIKFYIKKYWHRWFENPQTFILGDRLFIRKQYKQMTGKRISLRNPQSLNEKMQWLKLYNRNPLFHTMSDKYAVKKYVADRIGEEYVVPLIGVWNSFSEIDFDKLPDKFVLKCTHDSGGYYICRDKSKIDYNKLNEYFTKRLSVDFSKWFREWPYSGIQPRIIAEQYLENDDGSPIVDYKFYCYGGKLRYFMYSVGETQHSGTNHKFDMQKNSIDHLFKETTNLAIENVTFPENIDKMIEIAGILCDGMKHVRIDLYNINGHILFGEYTFFSNGGYINIYSKEFSDELASYIDTKKKVRL